MKKLTYLISLFVLLTQFSSAQIYQKTDQRGISNYFTNALLLPDSTLLLAEGIQESGSLRSALKAETISGEVLWEVISEDTAEVILYQNLIQLDAGSFGALGYHQTCCDCGNPLTIYEVRSIETGELISQEDQVLPNGIINNSFLNNRRAATLTSWGFSIVNSGIVSSTIFNLSADGDVLEFYNVPGIVRNTATLGGNLIIPSNQNLLSHDVEGELLNMAEIPGTPSAIKNSANTVALLYNEELILFDSDLEEIGTVPIMEGDYLMSGSETGYTLVSDDKFYRVDESGAILFELTPVGVPGFEADEISALDELYVLVGAKISEPFSIDQIRHEHAALQINDNEGAANLWNTNLTLTDITIGDIEIIEEEFFVNYEASVSVTIANTGSFAVEGFYLNHAQAAGICYPFFENSFIDETIPFNSEITVSLSDLNSYTLPATDDSLLIEICVFATNPMDQMDSDRSDDSICSSEYYIVSTDEIDMESSVSVFPNPSSGHVTVNSQLRIERLQLFNLEGRLIEESNLNGQNSVVLNDLPKGLYLIMLYTEKGKVTKKLVVTN